MFSDSDALPDFSDVFPSQFGHTSDYCLRDVAFYDVVSSHSPSQSQADSLQQRLAVQQQTQTTPTHSHSSSDLLGSSRGSQGCLDCFQSRQATSCACLLASHRRASSLHLHGLLAEVVDASVEGGAQPVRVRVSSANTTRGKNHGKARAMPRKYRETQPVLANGAAAVDTGPVAAAATTSAPPRSTRKPQLRRRRTALSCDACYASHRRCKLRDGAACEACTNRKRPCSLEVSARTVPETAPTKTTTDCKAAVMATTLGTTRHAAEAAVAEVTASSLPVEASVAALKEVALLDVALIAHAASATNAARANSEALAALPMPSSTACCVVRAGGGKFGDQDVMEPVVVAISEPMLQRCGLRREAVLGVRMQRLLAPCDANMFHDMLQVARLTCVSSSVTALERRDRVALLAADGTWRFADVDSRHFFVSDMNTNVDDDDSHGHSKPFLCRVCVRRFSDEIATPLFIDNEMRERIHAIVAEVHRSTRSSAFEDLSAQSHAEAKVV